ncbi:hypothetical protein JK636_18595 [Clostridium sp. YIM B02515]|uniref:Uncharacterized protein n=1 Tax=Clostridium rhizosphaerae TaxID=2803861 RepID=A0ABS1TEC2_9CLOT|nr:hypothetical protein [Clostridium rhizosphaerae]MBL4937719.1 hypothetical protein [Clostridium rhizosphaerae]
MTFVDLKNELEDLKNELEEIIYELKKRDMIEDKINLLKDRIDELDLDSSGSISEKLDNIISEKTEDINCLMDELVYGVEQVLNILQDNIELSISDEKREAIEEYLDDSIQIINDLDCQSIEYEDLETVKNNFELSINYDESRKKELDKKESKKRRNNRRNSEGLTLRQQIEKEQLLKTKELINQGLSDDQIAKNLGCNVRTIRNRKIKIKEIK